MRLSRPCYDKYWRCPGWAGGGWHWPKGEPRCDNGRIQVDYCARLWKWRFWGCGSCGVIVLPYHASKLSPWWWWRQLEWRFRKP